MFIVLPSFAFAIRDERRSPIAPDLYGLLGYKHFAPGGVQAATGAHTL